VTWVVLLYGALVTPGQDSEMMVGLRGEQDSTMMIGREGES
jgi:hypothetical protein